MKNVLLAVVCMALVGGVTGCRRKAAQEGTARLKIAVIPKGTTHSFWKTIHAPHERVASPVVHVTKE